MRRLKLWKGMRTSQNLYCLKNDPRLKPRFLSKLFSLHCDWDTFYQMVSDSKMSQVSDSFLKGSRTNHIEPTGDILGINCAYSPGALPSLPSQLEPKRGLLQLLANLRHHLTTVMIWLWSMLASGETQSFWLKLRREETGYHYNHFKNNTYTKTKQNFIYNWKLKQKILGSESVTLPRSLDQKGLQQAGKQTQGQSGLSYSRASPRARKVHNGREVKVC